MQTFMRTANNQSRGDSTNGDELIHSYVRKDRKHIVCGHGAISYKKMTYQICGKYGCESIMSLSNIVI